MVDGVKSTTSAMFGEAKFADRSASKGRDDARATATLTAGAPATAAEMN